MGYDLKILLDCHGGCRSCYEVRCRSKAENLKPYHLPSILSTLDRIIEEEKQREAAGGRRCNSPCLHGGEPLLIEFHDLHALCRKVYSYWGHGSIQTNLIDLTPDHIQLFRDYNISAGISLDGDTAALNRGRWNATGLGGQVAIDYTAKTLVNMRKLHRAGVQISIISILRRYNASAEALPDFKRFIGRLYEDFGITWGRTNPGIVFDERYRADEELSARELGAAFCELADLVLGDGRIIWQPYHDVVDMMLGYLDQTCNFNDCDPFHTRAEMAIDGGGRITNCLKSGPALDGIRCLQADAHSTERYDILCQLPQEMNGCKKCKWWWLCMGGCPGEGINNDWRNRTRFCSAYRTLFQHIDGKLRGLMPNLMLAQDFYPYRPEPGWCQRALNLQGNPSSYRNESKSRVDTVLRENEASLPGRLYGGVAGGGDRPHGDKPHGDHTDKNWGPS